MFTSAGECRLLMSQLFMYHLAGPLSSLKLGCWDVSYSASGRALPSRRQGEDLAGDVRLKQTIKYGSSIWLFYC